MKKVTRLMLVGILLVALLAGCSSGDNGDANNEENGDATVNTNDIVVVSREDGSGTRGAFIELFGIEEKDADGNKVDHTTDEATIVNSTSVVMTTVAGNPDSIGYISLGSLNDTVKALNVDGIEATVENIKNDTYKVFRPFNIATKDDASEATQDFIDFILSTEGQKVVEESGYIPIDGEAYDGTNPSGKIVVAGSSSVTPVMEKIKEAYLEINPDVEIEIQMSDSTTGMTSAMEGTCDIGMASRELKDSELEKLEPIVMAMDGLAVVVNNENPVDNITSEQVKEVFTGELITWGEIAE